MTIRLALISVSALFSISIMAAVASAQTAPAPLVPDPLIPGPLAPGPLVPESPTDPHEGLIKPPDELPNVPKGERNRNIDFLFGALRAAPDDVSAKAVEDRIWAVWTSAGSETANLLMSRAKKAADDKDYDLALRLLSAVIEVTPDFTEAWNRRATVYFLQRDYVNSMADIAKVLSREPRHFGALSGLGLIMQEVGDEKHALYAYRKALEVYPRLKGIEERVKSLAEKVDGRKI
jgi:hypothetical protein